MDDKQLVGYFEKFEKMQGFMINDLRKSCIDVQTNFLTALGCFNYIETLGGFYKNGKPGERFISTLNDLFPDIYKDTLAKLDQLIKPLDNSKTPVYDCLRCGMTHEYLIKSYENTDISFCIRGINNINEYNKCINEEKCGIRLRIFSPNIAHLDIFNPNLIEDLNKAFDIFKNKLLADNVIKEHFYTRSEKIHLERFN